MPASSHAKCARCGGGRHKHARFNLCGRCWQTWKKPQLIEAREMRQTRRIKKREGVMAGGAQQPGGTHAEILLEKPAAEPPQYKWQIYGDQVANAISEVAPSAIPPQAEMLGGHAQRMASFVQDLMDDDDVPPGAVAVGITKLATILADAEHTLTDLPSIRPVEKQDADQVYRGLGAAPPRLGNQASRERLADPTLRHEVTEAVRLGMSLREVRAAYGIGWEAMYEMLDEAGIQRPGRGRPRTRPQPTPTEEVTTVPTPPPARTPVPANGTDAAVLASRAANAKAWRITFVSSTTKTFEAATLDEAIAMVREGYGEDVDITNIGRA